MKIPLLYAALLAFLAGSLFTHAEPVPITTAVLDFQSTSDPQGETGKNVAALLSAKLSTYPSVLLVERQEIDKVLGEYELGSSGAEKSPDKIGQLIGAQVLVTGRVFSAGQANYLVAKVISVETGRVFGEVANFKEPADIPSAVDQMAAKVDAVLAGHAADLIAKPEAIDAAFQKLKEALAGRKLPSVTVSIAERQIGAPVPDPAAQTAMLHHLQDLGFPVIDPASGLQKADIVISGEAFSELGLRKGSLVACKARVEVKATRRDTGALLFTDSQRDVAFDLGEASTGKMALEKAASQLLLRIAPALKTN